MSKKLWQPYQADFLKDPYPMYQNLRNNAPVYKALSGEWILSDYTSIKAALTDDRFLSGNRLDWIKRSAEYLQNKDYDLQAIVGAVNNFLLMMNPPKHTEMRKYISFGWSSINFEQQVKQTINDLLNKIPADKFDFVKSIARPLTGITISKLLGIEYDEVKDLQKMSRKLVKSMDAYTSLQELVEMNDSAFAFSDFFYKKLVTDEIDKDSTFGKIISRNKQDRFLNNQQLVSTGLFLFLAGTETTVASLAQSVKFIAENKHTLKCINQSFSAFVDELLRFVGAVHLLGRVTGDDIQLNGLTIPKGSTVTLILASANRDEEHFVDADKFIPSRSPNRHMAFGQGRHYCMGDYIAKLQMQLFWEEIKERQINFLLADEVVYERQLSIRGIKKLPIIVK